MKCRFGFLIISLPLAHMTPAMGADLPVKSRIDRITVFRNGAEIARRFEAAVEAGSHVLVLADLPAGLDANSVRVDGEAGGAVEISSIDARRIIVNKTSGADASERKRIEADILRLTDERGRLDAIISAAEGQKALAENLSRLPISGLVRGGDAPNATATDWNALFDLIGARMEATAKTAQEARIKQRELDDTIAALRDRIQREPPEESERTEIRIHVDASAPATAALRMRYLVAQANWEPIYDARLTSGNRTRSASLILARRASISQNSGEDWNEATITLSTARPGGATAAPDLAPMKVSLRPEAPRPGQGVLDGRTRSLEKRMDNFAAAGKIDDRNAPVEEHEALVENAPYQASFTLPQPVTVKSGVGQKKLLISAEELNPSLMVLAVPKLDATAYLHAKFAYDGLSPLLPGSVSLYRDGVYIGQSALPLTLRGEEKELGFGPDDGVKVARVELKRAKGETGIISTSATDEQHFKITVKNAHDWTVPVTILDQLPVSETEQIAVDALPMTTEPSDRNYGDKLGVLAWIFDLDPQAEKEIKLSYQIKWPAKREITVSEY